MLVNCVCLYVAHAVDFIHTIVPAVFLYSHTSHTYSTAVAAFDNQQNKKKHKSTRRAKTFTNMDPDDFQNLTGTSLCKNTLDPCYNTVIGCHCPYRITTRTVLY